MPLKIHYRTFWLVSITSFPFKSLLTNSHIAKWLFWYNRNLQLMSLSFLFECFNVLLFTPLQKSIPCVKLSKYLKKKRQKKICRVHKTWTAAFHPTQTPCGFLYSASDLLNCLLIFRRVTILYSTYYVSRNIHWWEKLLIVMPDFGRHCYFMSVG